MKVLHKGSDIYSLPVAWVLNIERGFVAKLMWSAMLPPADSLTCTAASLCRVREYGCIASDLFRMPNATSNPCETPTSEMLILDKGEGTSQGK